VADRADPRALLAQIRAQVEHARAMPMSASAVVNRGELLGLVDALDAALRAGGRSRGHVGDAVAAAEVTAEQILQEARAEAQRLVEQRAVVQQARQQAEQLLEEARAEAERLRHDVDDYVDERLANFEVVLEKIAEAVRRGRSRLVGATRYDRMAAESDAGDPLPPG
jgi:cell division septum initiation protein DivIVA